MICVAWKRIARLQTELLDSKEKTARMKSDMKDRLKIRRKIQTLTDSLNPNEHPDGFVNIITGSTAADKVNVDMGLYI